MIKNHNSVSQFLSEVNNKIRLSDFIGQFVDLIAKGNSFVGKCPFHNENTPSFNVNNEKSFFYCFGCKAGGNILTFISKYKNLQFKESVNFISKYSGVPFIFDQNERKVSSDEKLISNLLNQSNIFFKELLKKNSFAYKYIRSRGVSDEIIDTYNIGFAPDSEILLKYLETKGYNLDKVQKTDLLIKNKQEKFFGRFSNRITFPIYNFANEIVGFGGRSIQNSKIKYINSQENLVFKKSQILYGLYQNIDYIREAKEVILVEGYMDVIKLYCSDIKNVVSTLGTTVSEIQLRKMWYFTDTPYLCFDGDKAGQEASIRIAEKVLKFLIPGKSLKLIEIPNNEDPDSYLQNNDRSDFLNLKLKSKDLSSIIWETIENSIATNTPEFLAVIDDKINSIVKKIDDPKVSKEYYRYLRSRKDNFIWNKNKIKASLPKKSNIELIIENINEKVFLLMIILNEKFLTEFEEEVFQVSLTNQVLEKIKKKVLEDFSNQVKINKKNIEYYKNIYPKLFEEITELKKTHIMGLSDEEKRIFFKQILNNLRLPYLMNERVSIQKEIIKSNESFISDNLLKKYNKISEEIKNIRNKNLE